MDDEKKQPLVYRLSQAMKLVEELSAQIHHNTGLSAPQALVLHALLKQNGVSLGRLSELADLDRSTVAKAVKVLIQKRLVIQSINLNDARVNLVSMTLEGQELGIKLLSTH